METYRTVIGRSSGEFDDRGSRFFGFVYPVSTEDEAIAFRHGIRDEIPEASHYVSAWILHDGHQHYSDAKEPHGTAGLPVFNVLSGHELEDVVCVVARIFGGTLLGRGGLMRAYTTAAQRAVAAAHIVTCVPCRDVLVTMAYPFYERVDALVRAEGASVLDTAFSDKVTMEFRVRAEDFDRLLRAVTDMTSGGAEVVAGDEQLQMLDVDVSSEDADACEAGDDIRLGTSSGADSHRPSDKHSGPGMRGGADSHRPSDKRGGNPADARPSRS